MNRINRVNTTTFSTHCNNFDIHYCSVVLHQNTKYIYSIITVINSIQCNLTATAQYTENDSVTTHSIIHFVTVPKGGTRTPLENVTD